LVRLGRRSLTWPELCRRAGVEHDVADRLWRALGFPDVPEDEPAYSEEDLRALRIAAEGVGELSEPDREAAVELIVREARTVSAHLSHIVEIQIDALSELQALGLRQRAVEAAFERGLEHSDLGWLLFYGLRRRLDESLRRRAEIGDQPAATVGFVDLVDFTRRSDDLEVGELSRLLERFEGLASDVVTEAGGRAVKMIGDEVMFVCPDPSKAIRAAVDIVASCASSELPEARARLAHGPLLLRAGDYFGAAVNLASRLVDRAEAGNVLVDQRLASALGPAGGISAEPVGERPLKGIGNVPVYRVAGSLRGG
jgi:adenylate cyclase